MKPVYTSLLLIPSLASAFVFQQGVDKLSENKPEQSKQQLTTTGQLTSPLRGQQRYRGDQDIIENMEHGFNGRKLTFVTKEWSYFIFAEDEEGTKRWRGSYIDLLEYLSRRLNFSFELTESTDDKWGTRGPDGLWDGVLGMVHERKADAGWVPFEVTFDRAGHFDFPSPTDYTSTVFIYRPPHSDLGPTLLLHPLSWQVWACVAASLPIVSAVLFLAVVLDLHQADDQTPASLSGSVDTLQRCLRLTVGAVFAEASEDDWRSGPSRVVVACWWAVTVVVAAAYSGSLVAHLSLASPHLPFCSLEDVVKQQEYTWGTLGNASVHTMITQSDVPLYRQFKEGLDRFTRSDPSVLATDEGTHYRKVISEKYVFLGLTDVTESWKRRDCRLVTGQETLKQSMQAPVFGKGSALTGYFSDVIDELRAYGLIDIWNSRWMNKSHCTVSTRPEGPVVISLSHLQGAFYVMAGGAGLSALLLVVEMCVGKRCFAQQK